MQRLKTRFRSQIWTKSRRVSKKMIKTEKNEVERSIKRFKFYFCRNFHLRKWVLSCSLNFQTRRAADEFLINFFLLFHAFVQFRLRRKKSSIFSYSHTQQNTTKKWRKIDFECLKRFVQRWDIHKLKLKELNAKNRSNFVCSEERSVHDLWWNPQTETCKVATRSELKTLRNPQNHHLTHVRRNEMNEREKDL